MRSIALANQKGGVGKTTTAIHLAHGLALRGERVLLADLDPQGNAAVALQGLRRPESPTASMQLSDSLWLLDAASREDAPNPACRAQLSRAISEVDPEWLIVDCPPRMDDWGMMGLSFCSEVIVPVQAEFLAMHGLSQILTTIQAAQGRCQLAGVLPTMVESREAITLEVVASLRANLKRQVFESVVFRDPVLVEAASHGQSVFTYAPRCKAALCYGEFLREVCDG